MEWVETTAKSVEEAQERALDQLGVAADEAEFEVLAEPKAGLFGRVRGEARVRARVRPVAVRPKQDRRNRGRGKQRRSNESKAGGGAAKTDERTNDSSPEPRTEAEQAPSKKPAKRPKQQQQAQQKPSKEQQVEQESSVTPQEVGDAAVTFMSGLADAFGSDSTTSLDVDGTELDVRVDGSELGLLIGPGGRTLMAVQDLARVASQRRLGDHDTRLRIDVAGYREKRREALEKFALAVASDVKEQGTAKALEPMPSADRKIVHDALAEVEGISSRSEGDDPGRRVVIAPA